MAKPYSGLTIRLLKNRLAMKPVITIIVKTPSKPGPGVKQRPEIIPKQNGRPIRRKGISLFSTVCSDED